MKYKKLVDAQNADLAAHKAGLEYSTGIALSEAKKRAIESTSNHRRNPIGTPKNKLRCKYHHENYCSILGHTTATSKDCRMHGASKKERDAASIFIMNELVKKELETKKDERK